MSVRNQRKLKWIVAILVGVSLLITVQVLLYLRYSHNTGIYRYLSRHTEFLLPQRIIHLDFKGGPPKLSFFRELLPLLSSGGATGLLVEYEDYFPYSGVLRNLSSRSAWSAAEVATFLGFAHAARLQVIPLVQTLGHMEFALKLAENVHLRENPSLPDTACPSAPAARDFISEMIHQVLVQHPESTSIHLGLDEARLSADCPRCQARRGGDVFLDHVRWAARAAVKLRPQVSVLVWDDMVRHWPLERMSRAAEVWRMVQPVVWAYSRDVIIEIPARTWLGYQRTIPNLWIASAFMGADGQTALTPNVSSRLENNIAWLRRSSATLVSSTRSKAARSRPASLSRVGAVVVTGWTRYEHFGALCETLPLGVHSLLLMLALVSSATTSDPVPTAVAAGRWTNLLNCPQEVPLPIPENVRQDPFLWSAALCSYPGSDLLRVVQKLWSIRKEIESIQKEYRCRTGWLSSQSISRNWSPSARLLDAQKVAERLSNSLKVLRKQLNESLRRYFDVDTTGEWLSQNVSPLQVVSKKIANDAKFQRRRITWPRGPPPSNARADNSAIIC